MHMRPFYHEPFLGARIAPEAAPQAPARVRGIRGWLACAVMLCALGQAILWCVTRCWAIA
jgi:hypothetical protein